MSAFKERRDVYNIPPLCVFKPTYKNFVELFGTRNFQGFLTNSLVVAVSSTAISVFAGSLAGYSLARFRIRGKKHIAFWILSIRMMPPIAAAIPLFLIMRNLGLLDTRISLILAYPLINLPYAVWMMRSFIQRIPRELEEAAMIDGCSFFGAFRRVVLPLVAPGLAATAALCFIFSWNEFLFSLLFTGVRARTLPVATVSFQTDRAVLWGQLCAGGLVIIIPVLLFVLLTQRYLVTGLTFGALKE